MPPGCTPTSRPPRACDPVPTPAPSLTAVRAACVPDAGPLQPLGQPPRERGDLLLPRSRSAAAAAVRCRGRVRRGRCGCPTASEMARAARSVRRAGPGAARLRQSGPRRSCGRERRCSSGQKPGDAGDAAVPAGLEAGVKQAIVADEQRPRLPGAAPPRASTRLVVSPLLSLMPGDEFRRRAAGSAPSRGVSPFVKAGRL